KAPTSDHGSDLGEHGVTAEHGAVDKGTGAGSFAAVQHGTHRSAARGAAGHRATTGTGITRVVDAVPARASVVIRNRARAEPPDRAGGWTREGPGHPVENGASFSPPVGRLRPEGCRGPSSVCPDPAPASRAVAATPRAR